MKDPTDKHFEVYGDDPDDGVCAEDGKKWPCPKVRAWRKTDTYRLSGLEDTVARFREAQLRNERETSELREKVRRLELFQQGATMPFLEDLAHGVTDGTVSVSVERQVDDVSDFGSSTVTRLAGPAEYKVKYSSSSMDVDDGRVTRKFSKS